MIAFETPARQGLVLGEDIIVEIVRPGTGEPVPDGEVGEVVVTTLNPDYPLVRFGTGTCRRCCPACRPRPHQHPHPRLDGPRRPDHQGARHVRASLAGGRCAAPPSGNPARAPGHQRHHRRRPHGAQDRVARGEDLARIADSLRDRTKLRGDVEWVDVGGLPNDGKVIDDVRTYE